MRCMLRWILTAVLMARCLSQEATLTVCDDESCRCDAFTRVICNCTRDYDEVTLRPDGAFRVPSMTTAIIVDGCARVHFLPGTVKGLQRLRNVELRNNLYVHFDDHALSWSPFPKEYELSNPGLHINIHNCTIYEVSSHAVRGRIDDIVISSSTINKIHPFAFSSLSGVKNILLVDNIYENIEIQAFKKFTTINFIMRGGSVKQMLPSRFLSDVEIVNLLKIDGVILNTISSLAFLANGPKRVLVERNIIDIFEGDAFHVATRGPVTFRNNTIRTLRKGALLGFSVERDVIADVGLQELLFENNTVTYLEPSSFLFNRTAHTFRIDATNINITCNCELVEEWGQILVEQGGAISCWYTMEEHFISIPSYIDSRCGTFKENFWIFIVVGVVLVVIIGLIIAYFVVKNEKDKKKKIPIVMPDGKTYRETEFHIVLQQAELLTTDL